jgi:hypothetical protein
VQIHGQASDHAVLDSAAGQGEHQITNEHIVTEELQPASKAARAVVAT